MTEPPRIPLDGEDALPRDAAGPVFAEPWEAQAFALAVHLVESGYFDRSEWAEALGEEIRAAQERGDPDRGGTYYRHWLSALERLCAAKGLAPRDAVLERTEEWRRAYLDTPHGEPVELPGGAERRRQGQRRLRAVANRFSVPMEGAVVVRDGRVIGPPGMTAEYLARYRAAWQAFYEHNDRSGLVELGILSEQ